MRSQRQPDSRCEKEKTSEVAYHLSSNRVTMKDSPWQKTGANAVETKKPATVTVTALSGGHFTIPEEQFVSPCVHGARTTVPSLCFLVQHVNEATGTTTRIIFDLGVRRDLSRYSEPIRRHTETRKPITTTPDVVQSLRKAGLTPESIGYVIYSHVGLRCVKHV